MDVNNIEKKVWAYIKANNMLEDCSNAVVGVSGGADSVCLMLMLNDYIIHNNKDVKLHIVHVNHGIRKEAADDEQFTRKLCESLKLDYHCYNIQCEKIARENNLTVEEAGRLERYDIFNKLSKQYDKTRIFVAHHMNDQAETVIMNMARGTSLKGIRGIVPVRDNICRPLLCITRQDIESWLVLRNQSFVTDVTNYDNDYTRNSIRNVLLPYMGEHINKNVVQNIAFMAQEVRAVENFVDKEADKLYKSCAIQDGAGIRLSVEQLGQADEVLGKRVIYKALVKLAGRAKDIYSVNVYDVYKLINLQTGRKVDSVYGIKAVREYEYIVLERKNRAENTFSDTASNRYRADIEPTAGAGLVEVHRIDITKCSKDSEVIVDIDKTVYIPEYDKMYSASIKMSVYDNNDNDEELAENASNGKICVNKLNNSYTKYFDYDKLNKLLDIRFKNVEDRIVVSESGNTKKLKKELTDRKIPASHRDEILLVCDNNRVLWACGVRRCEDCRVTGSTKNVFKIQLILKERN